MYFDENITFENEHLPRMLKEDLSILNDFYSQNKKIEFDNYCEGFEASVKSFYYAGKITDAQCERLFMKIGLR